MATEQPFDDREEVRQCPMPIAQKNSRGLKVLEQIFLRQANVERLLMGVLAAAILPRRDP